VTHPVASTPSPAMKASRLPIMSSNHPGLAVPAHCEGLEGGTTVIHPSGHSRTYGK
jgi:hypothetical protein